MAIAFGHRKRLMAHQFFNSVKVRSTLYKPACKSVAQAMKDYSLPIVFNAVIESEFRNNAVESVADLRNAFAATPWKNKLMVATLWANLQHGLDGGGHDGGSRQAAFGARASLARRTPNRDDAAFDVNIPPFEGEDFSRPKAAVEGQECLGVDVGAPLGERGQEDVSLFMRKKFEPAIVLGGFLDF